MLLEAFRRPNESITVELFGLTLVFKPNDKGHSVCDVPEQRAVDRLLSISEAYRVYDPDYADVTLLLHGQAAAPAPAPAPAPQEVNTDPDEDDEENEAFTAELRGSEDLPATYDVLGQTYTQAQVVELAFARARMTREAWNLNDDDDREALIEGEVTRLTIEAEKAAEAKAAEVHGDVPIVAANPFVISNGETTIDLRDLSEPKLRAFAKANNVTLPGGKSTKVDDLRLMVAKALTGD